MQIPRLTVSQLMHLSQPCPLTEQAALSQVFFTQHYVFLVNQNSCQLKKLCLKTFQLLQSLNLENRSTPINNLIEQKGFVVFSLEKNNNLFYLNHQRQVKIAASHFAPITKIKLYDNHIVTCSEDFTVRFWNFRQNSIVPDVKCHVLAGHSGRVLCVDTYGNFMITGSEDKSIIVWENRKIYIQKFFKMKVISVTNCLESEQLAVFTDNGQLSIINFKSIADNKKIEVLRVVKICEPGFQIQTTHAVQIDDSFMYITINDKIIFLQINLGQIIEEKKLSQIDCKNKGNILGILCIARLLIYGCEGQNLKLLKL